MDQEDTMDFKALRAKFQDQDLLKQYKVKPALPDKPKVVPPPQSPPHYLPAGARPSLLTSISQSLEGKTAIAPRVIFKEEKEDKKESKKPLIPTKGKDKSEGKTKASKDKTKKLDEDSSDHKQKKENGKDKKNLLVLPGAQKEATAELVPANPPPKSTMSKKKGFLGFIKSSKRDSMDITPEPILDTPSSDAPGAVPLIPVPPDFSNAPLEPEIQAPPSLLPNSFTVPESSAAGEIASPSTILETSDAIPPAAITPVIPVPEILTPESNIPLEIEDPALTVSRPSSQNGIIPKPLSAAPTPPPRSPEPEIATETAAEAVKAAAEPTSAPTSAPPSAPPSPKPERPISALSALERAEDMSPGKPTPPVDQRIFNALEKARRKTTSTSANSTRPYSISPPSEELSRPQSPSNAFPELPPIDYEDRAGKALQSKPAEINGLDHRQTSPVLEGIAEEGTEAIPELLLIPPPPPRQLLPEPESAGPAPEKPPRPPFVNLNEFIPPPPLEDNEIPAPLEFSETDTMDVPEFDDVVSDTYSPEQPSSEWGNEEHTVPDVLDTNSLPQYYSNGITLPETEISEPAFGDEYQYNLPVETSFSFPQDTTPVAEVHTVDGNCPTESAETTYEDISTSASKKKGKSDGGKKRKGTPKNPYAEAPQETVSPSTQEKVKTGRFGKSEKKAAAEGPDEKQLKKKEKQRLEKEKKELKEKQEREKKEQKEREKKENELKKKFKITGQEDALYQAKVTVTTKGRKNDLPVKCEDVISIIRTTNCPKGKWLARDRDNNYGYVSVDHVELDIKEMLELGKKTIHRPSNSVPDTEVDSPDKMASNHFAHSQESFTDDSEEWTGDEDDTLSPTTETADPLASVGHSRTLSMPDMGQKDLSINHQHSHSDISGEGSHIQARHEALHKLTTFFHSPKPVEAPASDEQDTTGPVFATEETAHEETAQEPEASPTQEISFELPEMIILPPPEFE